VPYAEIIKAATETREKAYAPYSRFKVGAALLTEDGKIYTGCNIENASYSHTICAERVAVFKAVCAGAKSFQAIAIVTELDDPASPCGACRQVLAEFSEDMKIIMANTEGKIIISNIKELLPMAFNKNHLGEGKDLE
jgi:cytidine deaminase